MRYSPSFSPDRIFEDDRTLSDSRFFTNSNPFPPSDSTKLHEHRFWLNDATLRSRTCMSDFGDDWMQSTGFGDFDLDCSDNSLPYNQSSPAPVDLAQLYGQHFYPQQSATAHHQQQSQSQSTSTHGRFPSTSSIASGFDSHFSYHPALPAQPYPNTQPQLSPFQVPQHNSWGFDSSISAQHLPTPTTTPTSDKHLQVPNPRRTKPTARHEAALAAAHNSARSALNQQWRSNSHQQSSQFQYLSHTSHDMPRTPRLSHSDDADMQSRNAGKATTYLVRHRRMTDFLGLTAPATVAKLDRTVSDAQVDELYNPATFTQTPPAAPRNQPQNSAYLQAQTSMLQDRLRDANQARSSSPSQASGHASPWRNSPYSDVVHYDSQNIVMPYAAGMRDKQKAKSEAYPMRQKKQESEEPKTVSPKDAFPEQQMAKEDEHLPSLFPSESNQSNTNTNVQYAPIGLSGSQDYNNYNSTTLPQSGFTFTMPNAPASSQSYYLQQQHPVQYGPVNGDYSYQPYPTPARLVSMETTKSDHSEPIQEESSPEPPPERPADTTANRGQYTCTYSDMHGPCHARFSTSGELNKHKREVHRQPGPMSNDAKRATAMTQTGPHKCTRNNPTTGKPCNTVFSRPYDLTRHQDTIHGQNTKFRCNSCTEEKLFSRRDALSRHMKVVHGVSTPTGKGRGRHTS